jgi:hypothetical protein
MPIYVDGAKYDIWLKLLLGGVIAILLITSIILSFDDPWNALIMFGVTAFNALLFYTILPHRYEVWSDRIRVVLGGPFAFSISFSSVAELRAGVGWNAIAYPGVRLATSTRTVVEIVRSRGWNMVISPSDRDMFLERAGQALEDWRRSSAER